MTDNLNLIETIAKNDTFSTFARLMGTSHANEAFSGGGDFTVFPPTNDAFGKIPDKQMNFLLNEPEQTSLKALLSQHILRGKLFAANLTSKGIVSTITGAELTVTDSNGLKIDGCGVQARNIEAANGVVHALDTVLTGRSKVTGPLSAAAEPAGNPQPGTVTAFTSEAAKTSGGVGAK